MARLQFSHIRFRAAVPIAAALLLLAVGITAARADLRLDVTTGFDNNYRIGSWTPMQVRLSGVSADTGAHLQVLVRTQSGTQVYGRNIRLRAGAVNGPFTVYYYHPELAQTKDITIQVSAEGRTLVDKTLDQAGNALSLPELQPAIIALTQDQAGLNFLSQLNINYTHPTNRGEEYQYYNNNGFPNGTNRPSFNRVIYPKAANLPDSPNGYEMLDAAVLGDLSLDLLNEDQWNALVGWVKSGGILVVSGSADLNRLRSKQLQEILPVEPTGVKQVRDLQGLRYQYGSAPKLRSSPVVTSRLKSDALALCRDGDTALVTERRLGNGLVVFTSFDMLAPEFRAWPGQAGMWAEIMQRGGGTVNIVRGIRAATEPLYTSSRFGFGSGVSQNRALTDALAGVQSTEAPSFKTIGIFLLCYILMLVPVNYLILKRWDRKELAWVTIPAIIFLFSAGAYAVGYRIKGGQLYLHYCSVLEGAANSDGWQAYSVGSIFSPRQSRYDLSITDPAAMVMEVTEGGGQSQRGMSDLVVDRDQKTTVKGALVNMWDHRQFDFQTFVSLGGRVAASVQPLGNNSARVVLTNGTTMGLSDCSISYGTTATMVGTLAGGETKTIKVNLLNAGGAGAISVIGSAVQGKGTAERQIREALANLAGGAAQFGPNGVQVNPNNPGQPAVVQHRTPFVLTGWFDQPAVGMALEGETPVVNGVNLLIVHLPTPEGRDSAPPPGSTQPPMARTDPFSGINGGPRPNVAMGGATPPPPVPPVPEPASTHNNLAYQYAQSGDLASALKEAEAALQAAPQNGMVLDTVGEMHQRRKEYAKAVPYYQKALKYLPAGQRTETEDKFGNTLLSLNKIPEATKHLKIAAADMSSTNGASARATLARIGGTKAKSAASTPLVKIAAGAPIPQMPGSGKGTRRILQPLAGGGSYYIVQTWDYTNGRSVASSSTTFVAAGGQVPR